MVVVVVESQLAFAVGHVGIEVEVGVIVAMVDPLRKIHSWLHTQLGSL